MRVDLFENFAVVTFTVKQSGMVVDNYSASEDNTLQWIVEQPLSWRNTKNGR